MSAKTRAQLKQAFAQGAWPQASDYSDLMDSFALVGEIPQGGDAAPQQVVKVPAGTIGTGKKYEISNRTGKYPCVNVYVERESMWVQLREVEVTLDGMKKVYVAVLDAAHVDVMQTGMVVVLC